MNQPARADRVPRTIPIKPAVVMVPIPAARLDRTTTPMACPMAVVSASTSS